MNQQNKFYQQNKKNATSLFYLKISSHTQIWPQGACKQINEKLIWWYADMEIN